jgi:hypothetical protein
MRFNRVIICSLLCVVVPSGSPENRTQRHVVISRVWVTSPRLPRFRSGWQDSNLRLRAPKARGSATTLHPESVRTAGFEPAISCTPSRRDTQASLRSVLSSPCGSRTRLFGLKGRCPQPIDERAVSARSFHAAEAQLGAHAERSGPGGARTLVCGFSGRRYTVSATSPTKKPGVTCTCDTGLLGTHRDLRSSVTSARDARAGYSPVDRRNALCILVRLLYLT